MHRGKVDPGVSELPRGNELSRDHVNRPLHCAIYRPDSFVLMLRYCANLKAIRYESTSFDRIVPYESDCVIAT